MKLSKEYIKDMKCMKIIDTIAFISYLVSSSLFFCIALNWILYFLHMDSGIEDFKLTSIIIELISGIIFFSLLLCEYKANKKKLINHIDLDNHGAYRFISKEAKIILDEVK